MSDDLVKRLRQSWNVEKSIMSQTGLWMREREEAAVRIAELEAKGLANRVAIMRLEAKLAKAVEGLDWVGRRSMILEADASNLRLHARMVIAELKGRNDG